MKLKKQNSKSILNYYYIICKLIIYFINNRLIEDTIDNNFLLVIKFINIYFNVID